LRVHGGAVAGLGEGLEEARDCGDVGSIGAGTGAWVTSWVASAVWLGEAACIGTPAPVAGAVWAGAET
jgi:hypothetical protein